MEKFLFIIASYALVVGTGCFISWLTSGNLSNWQPCALMVLIYEVSSFVYDYFEKHDE